MKNVLFILSALAALALPEAAAAQSAADFECRNERIRGGDLPILGTQHRVEEGHAYVETRLAPTGITVFGAPAISLVRLRGDGEEVLTAIVIGSYENIVRAAIVADEGIHSCDFRADSCDIGPIGSRGLQGFLTIRRIDSSTTLLECLFIG